MLTILTIALITIIVLNTIRPQTATPSGTSGPLVIEADQSDQINDGRVDLVGEPDRYSADRELFEREDVADLEWLHGDNLTWEPADTVTCRYCADYAEHQAGGCDIPF